MTNERDRLEAEREEQGVRELLAVLKEEVRAPTELRESVMQTIASERRPSIRGLLEWALRPRMVPLSPAVAAAAVAAVVTVLLMQPGSRPETTTSPSEAVETVESATTRFVLVAPGASSVHLTGDFISWRPDGVALEDLRGTGIWTGDVSLPPGVHQYVFVIDGSEWVADPRGLLQVDDGYGQMNSILVVSGTGEA